MRIGLLESLPLPPPLSLPPHPAASRAAAASAGAHHRSLRIPLLLTPLQTFAAIDCDRSGRAAVLSSENASAGGRYENRGQRGGAVDPRATNVGLSRICGAAVPATSARR